MTKIWSEEQNYRFSKHERAVRACFNEVAWNRDHMTSEPIMTQFSNVYVHRDHSVYAPANEKRRYSVTSFMTDSIVCPANERRCYFVTTFLIGWAQA